IDAWCTFNREHGTRPLAELLEPAARTAEEGYVVTPRVAADWHRAQEKLRDPVTAALFLPEGRPPKPGDKMRNAPLAATLRRIGREGREAFYDGAVMREIVARLKSLGGLHEEEDFAQHSNWVEPISASYRGYEVYECPPNGQGMAALMILRTLAGYALDGDAFSEADRLHLVAEASKAAYWVRDNFICDPEFVPVDVADFLSEARAERVRRTIRLDRAMPGPRGDALRRHGRTLSGGGPCAFHSPAARQRHGPAAGGRAAVHPAVRGHAAGRARQSRAGCCGACASRARDPAAGGAARRVPGDL